MQVHKNFFAIWIMVYFVNTIFAQQFIAKKQLKGYNIHHVRQITEICLQYCVTDRRLDIF